MPDGPNIPDANIADQSMSSGAGSGWPVMSVCRQLKLLSPGLSSGGLGNPLEDGLGLILGIAPTPIPLPWDPDWFLLISGLKT